MNGQLIGRGLDDRLIQTLKQRASRIGRSAEAANVLWSKVLKRDLTAADAEDRMLTLNRAPVVEPGISDLAQRASAVSAAHSITIYDSLHVALAEQRDVQLVTADVRLVRHLSTATPPRQRVVWISDLAG